MDFDVRVEGVELSLVGFEVRGIEVTDVDGTSAVVGKLVDRSPAYANWRIRACKRV
jgi:hypothetical protein